MLPPMTCCRTGQQQNVLMCLLKSLSIALSPKNGADKFTACPQVVGYMGVPYSGADMTSHPQYITVRNDRGEEMLDAVRSKLQTYPTESSGDRRPFVLQTVEADDKCVPCSH